MKRKTTKAPKPGKPLALAALKRAAKEAVERARRTGTPAYVLENGVLVDLAKRRGRKKNAGRT